MFDLQSSALPTELSKGERARGFFGEEGIRSPILSPVQIRKKKAFAEAPVFQASPWWSSG